MLFCNYYLPFNKGSCYAYMYNYRCEIYKELEKSFKSKIITYVTSDRPNMGAQIAKDVIDYFIDHLDKIEPCKKISLILYTSGGDTSAARNIVNLLRMYCDELQVIVPRKAHSSGTIISLGANEIVMTKQATLGPIDPSLQTPLNPIAPNGKGQVGVSVEAVKGYFEYAKKELNITNESLLADIFNKLSDYVHPLVLGEVYRSRTQIQMLAQKLLQNQVTDKDKIKKIIDFLCSESGSHDYTISRREAVDDLGLNVKKPSQKQYKLIKALYDDICDELKFNIPFSVEEINGAYIARRCLLESIAGGSDYFETEGEIIHGTTKDGQMAIKNMVKYNGWRHEGTTRKTQIIEIKESEEEVVYERINES